MNTKLFMDLEQTISKDRIRRNTEELHRLEGNESCSNFKASTDFAMKMMADAGFQKIERIALPADGKTTYFDSIMPQAWDSIGRSFIRLEDESLTLEDRMIADSDKDPFNSGIWGAPTPEGGVTCEIVEYKNTGKAEDVKGKLILMIGFPRDQYRFVAEHGAAGVIISSSNAGEEYPDHCRWNNGIGFVGWYHTAEDCRIPNFFITPRRAAFLRERLSKGKVIAHAEAHTRIYDGEFYTVTGIMPGVSSEEIIMEAHMYEPFLPDDSAGGAVICEICRSLKSLIEQGKLSPLKKTLRIVLSMEHYGFSQFYMDRERNARTLTVFNFDSCCHFPGGKDRPRLKIRLSSITRPSFMDWYLPEFFRTQLPDVSFLLERGSLSDDTFCSDDWIGIPSLWIHSANKRYHHNAGPMFMNADWDLACDVTRAMGFLIGTLATAGKVEFRQMAEETMSMAKAELSERFTAVRYDHKIDKLDCRYAAEKIRFLAKKAEERLETINRFAPKTVRPDDLKFISELAEEALAGIRKASGEPELYGAMEKAAKLIVTRLEPGVLMSLAKVPHDQRKQIGFEPIIYILLDGKRTLYEAMKLYEYEMDKTFSERDYQNRIDALRYLEKYGYVSIREI